MSAARSHPVPLAVNLDKIPRALRRLKNWVLWRYLPRVQKDGTKKWTKIPFRPNWQPASSTDARTWSSFDDVAAAYNLGRFDGIGFVTSRRDPFLLIDLDKVRDPKTGKIAPWAAAILLTAIKERGYVELSPSATGFHIIGEGPQGFVGRNANGVELYCIERYLTISGGLQFDPKQIKLGTLNKTIGLVSARLGIAKPVHRANRGSPRSAGPAIVGARPYATSWTDADILSLAFKKKNGDKLKRLLDGNTSDYANNDSSADLACASMLSFWFWLNPEAIKRVMKNSKLARDKWEDKRGKIDFLTYTINFALAGKEDYYGKPCRVASMPECATRRAAVASIKKWAAHV